LDSGSTKGTKALQILDDASGLVISTQVIGEFITATTRKGVLSFETASTWARDFMNSLQTVVIDINCIEAAVLLKWKYGYAYYDSLIIATALQTGCTHLYPEDMHHGQIVDTLTIINPFI
jgi:predicted nucleic acid-binding protein